MEATANKGLRLFQSLPRVSFSRRLLALSRAVVVAAVILGGMPLMYFYLLLEMTRIVRPARVRHWRARDTARWAGLVLCLIGVHIQTDGQPPPRGSMLTPNHQSYLDIIILLAVAPGVFVSNDGVRSWPFFGHLTAGLGTIYVDRSRGRSMHQILPRVVRTLREGIRVVVFLETTTSDGHQVRPFRPGFLSAAIEAGTPCVPVTIRYSTPNDAPPVAATVCWWGKMPFLPHLWRMLSLRKIDVRVQFGPPVPAAGEMDRKFLARQLHERVSGQNRPTEEDLHSNGLFLD